MLARTLLVVTTAAALLSVTERADAQIRMGRPGGAPFPRSASPDDAPGQPRGTSTLLGVTLTTSGSDRDTLGMLVSAVGRGSPADRAGVDVGSRVAALNDASLRIDPADVGDRAAQSRVQRKLALALRGLQPGDDVTLRVFSDGVYRLLSLRTADDAAAASNAEARGDVGGDVAANLAPVPGPDLAGEPGALSAGRRQPPASVSTVLRMLADVQSQLRQLEDAEDSGPLVDSLMRAERDILSAEHRLRAADAPRRRTIAESDNGAIGATIRSGSENGSLGATGRGLASRGEGSRGDMLSLPGLRLAPVSQGLTSYFGDGSERGLLVMQADPSWSPIHVGDVILRVDDAPVDAEALRAASDPQRQASVDLLRRRRLLTVTLHTED